MVLIEGLAKGFLGLPGAGMAHQPAWHPPPASLHVLPTGHTMLQAQMRLAWLGCDPTVPGLGEGGAPLRPAGGTGGGGTQDFKGSVSLHAAAIKNNPGFRSRVPSCPRKGHLSGQTDKSFISSVWVLLNASHIYVKYRMLINTG